MDDDVAEIYNVIWPSFVGVPHPAMSDLAFVRVMRLEPSIGDLERAKAQIAERLKRDFEDDFERLLRGTPDNPRDADRHTLWLMDVGMSSEDRLQRNLDVLDRCLAVARLAETQP